MSQPSSDLQPHFAIRIKGWHRDDALTTAASAPPDFEPQTACKPGHVQFLRKPIVLIGRSGDLGAYVLDHEVNYSCVDDEFIFAS